MTPTASKGYASRCTMMCIPFSDSFPIFITSSKKSGQSWPWLGMNSPKQSLLKPPLVGWSRLLAMSWYSKRSSRWWQDSENEWREKGAKDSSGTSETWSQSRGKARNEWASRNKGDWKGSERSEWSQWSKEGEWREGEWSRSDKADWKTGEKSEIEKSQGQWAKTEPRVEVPPNPAASLEDALADVERLLGESLGSTRKLLDESHNSSKESVHLATRALELLTRQTAEPWLCVEGNFCFLSKEFAWNCTMWIHLGEFTGIFGNGNIVM